MSLGPGKSGALPRMSGLEWAALEIARLRDAHLQRARFVDGADRLAALARAEGAHEALEAVRAEAGRERESAGGAE